MDKELEVLLTITFKGIGLVFEFGTEVEFYEYFVHETVPW
jgi:hypothetical protein